MYGYSKRRALAFVLGAVAAVSATAAVARIIGEDGRRSLSADEEQRYRAVGLVVVDNGKHVYGGTGTLVNDRHTVLTVFHNVFHDGRTGPVGQVQAPLGMMHFVIGENDDLTYYRIKSIRPYNRNYGLVLADENDLAVLTLDEPVEGVEPLSLHALGDGDDGQSLDAVVLVAYTGLQKSVQFCRFRQRAGSYPRSADVLVHDCDSEGNASGSPFLDVSGRIVALHLGGSPHGLNKPGRPFNAWLNFNVARKITADVFPFVDGADPKR